MLTLESWCVSREMTVSNRRQGWRGEARCFQLARAGWRNSAVLFGGFATLKDAKVCQFILVSRDAGLRCQRRVLLFSSITAGAL